MRYCEQCGSQISDTAKFCPQCGAPVHSVDNDLNNITENTPVTKPTTDNSTMLVDSSEPKTNNKFWIYTAIIAATALVIGLGFLFSQGKYNSDDNNIVDSTMVGNVSIPSGKYTLVVYPDNTGDFFTPDGGRICGFELANGRTEPLTLRLTKKILIMGHNTNDLYASRDRLFGDYSDYLKYYNDYNPDTTLGTPLVKFDKERTTVMAVDLSADQIETFNTTKHEIGPNSNDLYTQIFYDDESGHLFDSDGSHVCAVKKGYSSDGMGFRLSKSVTLYGKSTEELYVMNGNLFVCFSDMSDDRYAYDGDQSKRKAVVDIAEEGDATIYRFSKTEAAPEIVHNDKKHYSSDTYSSTSSASGGVNLNSLSDLAQTLPGTVWVSSYNGSFYRVKLSSNNKAYFTMGSRSVGWVDDDEMWWKISEDFADDTLEKCYSVSLSDDKNGNAKIVLLFFKDGKVSFNGCGRSGLRAQEGDLKLK